MKDIDFPKEMKAHVGINDDDTEGDIFSNSKWKRAKN